MSSSWQVDRLVIRSEASRSDMAKTASLDLAATLHQLLAAKDRVSVMFAAAPSQQDTLALLCREKAIDWSRITAFHMDEYIGLEAGHMARFANWLDRYLFSHLPFGAVHRIEPHRFASPEACATDYACRLAAEPLDLVCLGVGINGHLAFNDPPEARFDEKEAVKVVTLAQDCRAQQVEDECFAQLTDVPQRAITVTIPALLAATSMICIVPGALKKEAVTRMLTGPVTEDCPASILRTHNQARLYIDSDSMPDVDRRAA
ncbi:6-phosphogluconolactonase [Rhizobium sp. UGM030330-04]|uniref:6-phosphogluconolactonase n=1 Tax=Rhizobium sp. UGM030330-04 TaxID=1378077 RepID=UPI000D9325BD|nr:6-phosphogluconolactonase [Rhizobium sp. UGM030330-04]PYG58333.1 glucosamine-6-phosphate deaminase [Rhizobium sp. UGM030330-04]